MQKLTKLMATSFGRDCLCVSTFNTNELPRLDSSSLTDSILKVALRRGGEL